MIGLSFVDRKPTAFELAFASVVPRHLGLNGFTRNQLCEPDFYVAFLYALASAWMALYIAYGLALLGIWAGLHSLGFIGHIGAAAFEVGAGFCIVGACDAGLRVLPAWVARARYLHSGRKLDRRGRLLMKLALTNDATILLQIAGGVLFALYGP